LLYNVRKKLDYGSRTKNLYILEVSVVFASM